MLHASGGVQCVRRVVIRVNQRWRRGAVLQASRVNGLKCIHPAVLRQVVEINANARANNGFSGRTQRLCDPQSWRKLFTVVVRDAVNESGSKCGIETLVVSGGDE